MGTSASRSSAAREGSSSGSARDGDLDSGVEQLYVSLKMENFTLKGDLVPHVYGSVPIIGSWDSTKALPMERESASTWELSFVVPANHDMLDFKFLLKPKHCNVPCVVEEGPDRLLEGGRLGKDSPVALFHLNQGGKEVVVEYKVFIKAVMVSPFDLAASWRAYQDNLEPSTVRGIPDVSINNVPEGFEEGSENGHTSDLELDLEHYEVPTPTSAASGAFYVADLSASPSSLELTSDADVPHMGSDGSNNVSSCSVDRAASTKDDVFAPGSSKNLSSNEMESKREISPLPHKQEGNRTLYVDRGVGSPRLARSVSASAFTISSILKLDSESKKAMPAAAGAVAAAAVADRMLGPKEGRQLAIVLVGLPARGKTFTAAKLTRYLRWLGHETKHFNVGKYRRLKHGANQSAEFFSADNREGLEARNEVAALAMEDMLAWMREGGQVGIFDATNSTKERRNMLLKMAEGKCKMIFLETICNDEGIIERNILLKIQQSPDYAEETDFEAGLRDFKARLANYEKAYEPVNEGSYIKMIDMVSGHGGQIQMNNISGYLPGRIVFFLVNTHLTPRPILLTRHGESRDNVRGRIGGDTVLSEAGELYSKKLANFLEKRLKNERTASIWTSTLQRTILTAGSIIGFPKIQWRALDEINAGVCDGMTYEEIKKNMPEEYESRKKDKLRYRYPRGESYLDVIQRLEPVIIELERQRAPVVVISHQAVLRALYGYFADKPLKEIPFVEVPLHTIIEIQMGVSGVQEKRYKLMD